LTHRIHQIKEPLCFKAIRDLLKNASKPNIPIAIKKFLNALNGFFLILDTFYFIFACSIKARLGNEQIYVAGDPQGLIAAYLLCRKKRNILVYWSLELWIKSDISSYFGRLIKLLEKFCNQRALCTIEFGEMRCEILRKENNLAKNSMVAIPNAPLGDAEFQRNFFFNSKFDIPLYQKIVLFAGGMSDDHMLTDILQSLKRWPDNIVLVLHFTRSDKKRVDYLKTIPISNNTLVYFSLDPVNYRDLRTIYSSADIGLQFFKPRIMNLKYADWCSGKLFQYMRAGVPVITNNLPGYQDLIQKNGIGECISKIDDLGRAIDKINRDHRFYRDNCIRTFANYRFVDYHAELEKIIENGFTNSKLRG